LDETALMEDNVQEVNSCTFGLFQHTVIWPEKI